MDQGAGMKDGADMDEGTGLDVQGAAAIMREAGDRAAGELRVRRPVIFASAGLALLLGYGAIWLSVRGQRPYHGPTAASAFVLIMLTGVAVAVTASVVGRAAEGVGGLSAQRRRIFRVSLVMGYLGVILMEAALDHAGVSRSVTFGVFAAATPVLVTGVVYIANSAGALDLTFFGLGCCLVVVAAASSFAGPVTVWAVDAVAGGVAYLLMAVFQPWLRRS
jgi:hypothetical protein